MKGGNAGKSGGDPKYLPLQPPPAMPMLPPPEPPSKLYEDDDFDLYADIETPTPSKLAPPPEPPALLFALDGDDKDEGGGDGSDEEAGLVIDDRNDAYDPEMPTSPPSPTPSENEKKADKERMAKNEALSSILYPALEDIPPPPSPPPKDRDKGHDSDSECPNQGLYSKLSMQIAKGKSDSDNSDKEDDVLPPPPPLPPFGSLDLSINADKTSKTLEEQEVAKDLEMDKCKLSDAIGDTISSVKKMEEEAFDSESETVEQDSKVEVEEETCSKNEISEEPGEPDSPKSGGKAVRDSELSEGELEDESSEKELMAPEDKAKPNSVNSSGSALSSDDLPFLSESDKPSSESDGKGLRKSVNHREDSLNGSQESLPSVGKSDTDKPNKSKSNVDGENDGEPDLLDLGCEEERDGLVDITDEEISNYERSWEMEDNRKQGKSAGLEGLETEAISDCDDPPGEGDKQDDKAEKPRSNEIVENGTKEEEGEIVVEERTPVQWKKLSKTSKERSYRGDKEVKTKEKNKEITTRKKEKRKELERYDVRKLISEKPRRKVDEFGRDISSHSRSNSRSLSRGRRSLSRSKKKRSKSRSRSKERTKERGRSRERAKERSRERSRSKDKVRRERSKDRKSRSRSKKRRKSRSPRKERGRSREKTSRERKKRKKSPSMSCSSCSCSSCEREKRRSKKLTVIVTNEDVVGKRGREKGKTKNKEKKSGSSPKSRRRNSPVPSKEVFTSGDNILVSVNFKSSKSGEGKSKDSSSSKRKKDDETKKKKDKGTKENQPVRSIVTAKKSKKNKLNTKNMKPVAIIDLESSPFRETILSPKEIIILTDSDSEDKLPQVDNAMPVPVTGPKTPPEPLIKFNIVNNKQQQLRTMANPLLDSLLEQLEGEGDDEPSEIIHKGPNTPPEPPVPYDPFEPTKSRSPTPGPDTEMDRHMSPTPEANQRHSPQQSQTPLTPPKLPQHVAPKTPSPLHSPPKVVDEPDKPKLLPFQPAGMDSDNDSGGGGGGGGDSPYSPGSSEGDDLFEPPMPQPGPGSKPKPRPLPPPAQNNKHGAPAKVSVKKRQNKTHKENSKKGSSKKEIGIKLDEDQLKILDELPNSAVEMQVKDKFLKKLNRQERVVEEVKMVLKPHYAKKHVTKEEYKEILRKSVPKICHSRSGEINPMKIQRLIEAYVKKYRHKSKKRGGAPAIPPLRQNKGKTLWC